MAGKVWLRKLLVDRYGLRFEGQLDLSIVAGVDEDDVAGFELSFEQFHRQRIDDQFLQRALEWARAEGRVVALFRELAFGVVADLDGDAAIGNHLRQLADLDLDD